MSNYVMVKIPCIDKTTTPIADICSRVKYVPSPVKAAIRVVMSEMENNRLQKEFLSFKGSIFKFYIECIEARKASTPLPEISSPKEYDSSH